MEAAPPPLRATKRAWIGSMIAPCRKASSIRAGKGTPHRIPRTRSSTDEGKLADRRRQRAGRRNRTRPWDSHAATFITSRPPPPRLLRRQRDTPPADSQRADWPRRRNAGDDAFDWLAGYTSDVTVSIWKQLLLARIKHQRLVVLLAPPPHGICSSCTAAGGSKEDTCTAVACTVAAQDW